MPLGVRHRLRPHHPVGQGDKAAGVGLQEGGQFLVVHPHRFDHADDLQVFFLGELRLQFPKALLLGGDLLLRLFDVFANLLNRCHVCKTPFQIVLSRNSFAPGP